MSELGIQVIALFGLIVVGLLFILEARKWQSLGTVIGRGQRRLRVWLIVLIELLFVMMFIGPFVTGRDQPLMEIIYWMLAVFLALAVLVLAMFDLRAVAKRYAMINRETFGDLRRDDRDEL